MSWSLVAGESIQATARTLSRAPSTISREIVRNGGPDRYRALDAEAGAWQRAKRPKPSRLAINASLQRLVAAKLRTKWSPEQSAGWLVSTYPEDATMQRPFIGASTCKRAAP